MTLGAAITALGQVPERARRLLAEMVAWAIGLRDWLLGHIDDMLAGDDD